MISKQTVIQLVNDFLEGTDRFLVEVKVSTSNRVAVFIDGDKGVSIADCIELSRHLEGALDREKEDFELDVSSAGVGSPLVLPRQFRNNLGRTLVVKDLENNTFRGKLEAAEGDGIQLRLEEGARKGRKKKSEDPLQTHISLSFDRISEAKVQPSFK